MKYLSLITLILALMLASCGSDSTTNGASDAPPANDIVMGQLSLRYIPGVLDNTTGLFWQMSEGKNATWQQAGDYCASLAPLGFWRLPDIDELRSLVTGCSAIETGGACPVTVDCLSCSTDDCSCDTGYYIAPAFEMEDSDFYWSSSPHADLDTLAWGVNFVYGLVSYAPKTANYNNVRCVH